MSRALALFRLQAVDLELDALRARLRAIEAALSDSPAVRSAQKQMLEAQTRLETARIAARELEQEERAAEARRAEVEERLYSGRVTNPKELQDLERDLASLKRQCGAIEEQQLQALINAEAAEARSVAAQNTLQSAELEAAKTNGVLGDEQVQTRQRLAALEQAREGAAGVRAEDLAAYAHLREIKKGRAVSQLVDGVCAACGVEPSASRVQDARQGLELIMCGNCGRILYAD